MKVCVIGAGAGGLICARRLLSKAHKVTVFESQARLGGVWNLEKSESPMYDGLVTNLPLEVMAVPDFPFASAGITSSENKLKSSFLTSAEVETYLRAFAQNFDLLHHVKFDHHVNLVSRSENGGWNVRTRISGLSNSTSQTETFHFDSVVVCNGHFNVPRFPSSIGEKERKNWRGKIIHSKYYKNPEPFKNKIVVVVGAKSSGTDIAKEISSVASEVHVCDPDCPKTESPNDNQGEILLIKLQNGVRCWNMENTNLFWRPRLESLDSGSNVVRFEDGSSMHADAVIFATGYNYDYEFFAKEDKIIEVVDGKLVKPLYRHLQHRKYPTLFFLGLPFGIAPFPLFEVQATWINYALQRLDVSSDTGEDPYDPELAEDLSLSHYMGQGKQWDYCRYLAAECGMQRDEAEVQKVIDIYKYVSSKRPKYPGAPDTYRQLDFSLIPLPET